MINTIKVNKFMPPNVKNRKSRAYTVREIQKLLDIADERLGARYPYSIKHGNENRRTCRLNCR